MATYRWPASFNTTELQMFTRAPRSVQLQAGTCEACEQLVGSSPRVRITSPVRTLARRFVVKTAFPWVANRANMLYLAVRTHFRAAETYYV